MHLKYNPDFIHHRYPQASNTMREVVFGMEDGMVSTLGAITGIATATQDQFVTILSGLVVISVESISMAVGSYLSSKSVKDIDERKLFEEKTEIKDFPEEEKQELAQMYIEDGWPKELAQQMAQTAARDKKLILKEMAYRELQVSPDNLGHPLRNGVFMGFSYVVGGAIPLLAYLFLSIWPAVAFSIGITLCGLFFLGVFTTKFTKRHWWKAGLEMLGLASLAAIIGYGVGQLVDMLWLG